jgi:hypothetical protein
MHRILPLAVLFAALAFVPSLTVAQATKKVDEATVRAKLLMAQTPVIDGKFTTLDLEGDEKKLVLTYTYVVSRKPKKDGFKKYQDAAIKYNAALERRDSTLELIKKLKAEVDDAAKDAFDVEEIAVNFDLKISDKTPIRVSGVPLNEDGSPMALNAAQLAKLKGDPKLPGYTAKLSDLNKLNAMQVTIDKSKIKKGDDTTIYPASIIMIVLSKPEEEFKPVPLK